MVSDPEAIEELLAYVSERSKEGEWVGERFCRWHKAFVVLVETTAKRDVVMDQLVGAVKKMRPWLIHPSSPQRHDNSCESRSGGAGACDCPVPAMDAAIDAAAELGMVRAEGK